MAVCSELASLTLVKTLKQAPAFRMALFLALGILLTRALEVPIWIPSLLPAAYLLYSFIDRSNRLGPAWERQSSLLAMLTLIGLGSFLWEANSSGTAAPQIDLAPGTHMVAATVSSEPRYSAYGAYFFLEVFSFSQSSPGEQHALPMIAYLDSSLARGLQVGDSLALRGGIKDLVPKAGFKASLWDRGIRHELRVERLSILGKSQALGNRALDLRDHLASGLNERVENPRAAALASALLLGQKRGLTKDIRKAFSAAGLSHILAISGLHVGIIFSLLAFLFMPLHLLPGGRRLRHVATLLVLIAYMYVTGAAPSVVRAVLMLGTVLIIKILYRRFRLLNLLGFAALVQLIMDPEVLFSLGFQLSYSAVFGIAWILPMYSKHLRSRHRILRPIQDLVAVSLAATAFTTPLVISTFGAFPVYFILSNLLATLPAYVAVLSGFMSLIFGDIPFLGDLLFFLLEKSILLLDLVASWVASLPHAVLRLENPLLPGLLILGLQLFVAGLVFGVPAIQRLPRLREAPMPQPA